ncbi:MAG: hypothetical protein WBP13_08685 [Methylophilaceae bacterium]
MATFSYWLQHADFSTDEGTIVDSITAPSLFTSHDWDAELSAAKKLVEAGVKQTCPPTICFFSEAEAGDLALHIRPLNWSTAEIQYRFPFQKTPLFGFIPRVPVIKDHTASSIPIDSVVSAIDLFIGSRHVEMLVFLSQA